MLKKHIVLFESKDHGWIAYSTTGADAKRILNVNKLYKVFYIFKCNIEKQYPYTMKLKYPFCNYYDCKKIINYKEENFEKDDACVIISYDLSICFDVKIVSN